VSAARAPVLDGAALRAQLDTAASAGDAAKVRAAAVGVLREALERGRAEVRARLESGVGGLAAARLQSDLADTVVCALYRFVTTHVFEARNPTEGERLAVAATGGYGRGLLAPFSDLDLLFLRPWKPTAYVEGVIEWMLYALWDMGLKVGHASRTVDECLRAARADMTTRTALLDARRLAGDAPLFDEFRRRYRDDLAAGTGPEFVEAKLAERAARHQRAGATRYLVEPNVKDGKGALRDVQTLFWIAAYLIPATSRPRFWRWSTSKAATCSRSGAQRTSSGRCAPTSITPPDGRRTGWGSICRPTSPVAWASTAVGATRPRCSASCAATS
jgi:[protein-PII] uridylyltransferase